MFKKGISVVNTRPLSGKDVKKLKKDVEINFPDLTEAEISTLVPSKADVSLLKLSNRSQAYTVNSSTPLFFDPEGRGDVLVPTVYALWQFPHMLPALQTYSEVSPKVLGGADLFLQGLIVPDGGLGDFSVGDLWAVKIPGNPFPFAVGLLEVSSEEVARKGLTGRGLKLLHHYPDLLWGLGSKSTPDDSFTPVRVFPQGQGAPTATAAAASPPAPQEAKPPTEQLAAVSLHENGAAHSNGAGESQAEAPAAASQPQQPPVPASQAPAQRSAPPAARPPQPEQANDPDSRMQRALFAGLCSVQDSELPMLTSDLWSKHMLQGRAAGAELDIKKTSYKKLSKLLSTFEKKGLLTTKLVHKQDNLASINRGHELLQAHAEHAAAAEPTSAPEPEEEPSTSGKIQVSYQYRVGSMMRPIFGGDLAVPDALYTEEDCRQALRSYAARQNLQGPNNTIVLDKLLVGTVYNKKEPEAEGDEVDAERLLQRLLVKLLRFNCVTRHTDEGVKQTVQRGELKPIVVSMEDRQGGRKHLTRVWGLEAFALDPDELAGVLQRKFQTNASVQKLPGKTETAKEIALQGNLLHDIPRLLIEQYGIDPQFVEVKSKGK